MRAIAGREHARALAQLRGDPSLAVATLDVGATRAMAREFFFDDIRHYAYGGDSALHVAAAAHDVNMARTLVRLGASVAVENRRGARPLHYAVDGSPGVAGFRPSAQVAIVKYLLAAGADPNARDRGGVTPLHRAVRNRCLGAVRVLLAGGADARLRNAAGSTALDLTRWTTGRSGSGSAPARAAAAAIAELLQAHLTTYGRV
jgi:Ankyrin repeats (many copies)/Ankyrin repeat